MAQLFLGLLLIYHLDALSFLSTLLPLQLVPFVKVFHKDQSLDHSYSYSILLLLVLLSLIRLSVIIYLLMTLNCSSPSQPFSHSINLKLLLTSLPAQLSKISDPSLLMPSKVTITPAQSARIIGVIFDSTISDHISSVSKSCFLSIHDLRKIKKLKLILKFI